MISTAFLGSDMQGSITAVLLRSVYGASFNTLYYSRTGMVNKFQELAQKGQVEDTEYLFAGHSLPNTLVTNCINSFKFFGVFNQECGAEPMQNRIWVEEGKSLPLLVMDSLNLVQHTPPAVRKLVVLMEKYYRRQNTSESLGLSLLFSKYFCDKFTHRFASGFDGFDLSEQHYISVEKKKMMEHFKNLNLWIGKWCGLNALVNIGQNKYPTDTCYYMSNLNSGAHVVISIDFNQEWASARLTPRGEEILLPKGFHLGKFINNDFETIIPRPWPTISNGGGTATSGGLKFPDDNAINDLMTNGQFTKFN
jgi:hypothetical protein